MNALLAAWRRWRGPARITALPQAMSLKDFNALFAEAEPRSKARTELKVFRDACLYVSDDRTAYGRALIQLAGRANAALARQYLPDHILEGVHKSLLAEFRFEEALS